MPFLLVVIAPSIAFMLAIASGWLGEGMTLAGYALVAAVVALLMHFFAIPHTSHRDKPPGERSLYAGLMGLFWPGMAASYVLLFLGVEPKGWR